MTSNINQSFAKSLPKGIQRDIGFFNEEELSFNTQYKAFIKDLTDRQYLDFMSEYRLVCNKLEDLLEKYNLIAVHNMKGPITDQEKIENLTKQNETLVEEVRQLKVNQFKSPYKFSKHQGHI